MWLIWVIFPERFPLVALAEEEGAELADGVAAGGAPAHAAAGEAVVDDGFASAFDRAGADLPALAQVIGIVHFVFVVSEIVSFHGD